MLWSCFTIFSDISGKTIIPPTRRIFAMLLPTRFPATMPSAPIWRAWKVAANSGNEVPIAIIKIPTNISLICSIFIVIRKKDEERYAKNG